MRSLCPTWRCYWSLDKIISSGKQRAVSWSWALLCSLSKMILVQIYIILDGLCFCLLAHGQSWGHSCEVSACHLHHEAFPSRVLPMPGIASSHSGPPTVSITLQGCVWPLRRQWKQVLRSLASALCSSHTPTKRKKCFWLTSWSLSQQRGNRIAGKDAYLAGFLPATEVPVHCYPIHNSQMNRWGKV